jgi:hypothetical protein
MSADTIRTLPTDQARAALMALPPILRNLPTYRDLAAELDHRATTPTPAPARIHQPTPAPIQATTPSARPNPEPSAGTLEIVQWCAAEHIPAELVGRWVWVQFPAKPAPEIIEKMKARGFRWVKTRGRWAHDCGHKSRRGKGDPRDKYGSVEIEEAARRMARA